MIKKKSINILKHKIKLPMDQMWDDDSMTSEHRRTWIKTRVKKMRLIKLSRIHIFINSTV